MRIAVVGATGALGKEVLTVLAEEANAPEWGGLEPPVLLATKESAGQTFPWVDEDEVEVEAFSAEALRGTELAILATPEASSRDAAAVLRAQGAGVVDASRAHRQQSPPWLAGRPLAGVQVVSLPSAEGLMLARALVGLTSLRPQWIRATVLKAASGAGEAGVSDLAESTAKLLSGQEPEAPRLAHRLAFNVVPQAGAFTESDGADETALSVELPALVGHALEAAVTVGYGPWFYGHFADVTVGLSAPAQVEAVRDALRQAPGVKLVDDPAQGVYPMPSLATGDEDVLVGRVRPDPIDPQAVRFIVACDNVRASAVHAVSALKALAKLRRAH